MRYFISDLHIGDKSSWDHFGDRKANSLIKLLERIDHDTKHNGELILLGDVFDFTIMAGYDQVPQKIDSGLIFAQVERAYPSIFKAFRDFIREGNRLFYVWGNHDYLMRFQKHDYEFQKAILKRFWDYNKRWRIAFADYYISPSHKIFAEHGHKYDPACVHLEGDKIIFGNLMAGRVVMKWETWENKELPESERSMESRFPFKILSDIRPWPNVVYYINRLIKKGILPENVKKELVADLYSIHEETSATAPHLFFRILESMPWFIQDGIMSSRLKDETPRRFREKAKLLLKGYSSELSISKKKMSAGIRHDLNFAPQILIFGHSHFLDRAFFEDNYIYVNTGSWHGSVFVNSEGEVIKINTYCPYIEVFPPEPGGAPKAFIRRAEDGREIDFDQIKMEYKKLGYNLE